MTPLQVGLDDLSIPITYDNLRGEFIIFSVISTRDGMAAAQIRHSKNKNNPIETHLRQNGYGPLVVCVQTVIIVIAQTE